MSRSSLLVAALAPSLAAAAPCEQRGAKLADARLVDEGHVVACYASCWSFDLATRTWAPTGPLPRAADPPPPVEPPSVPATFTTTLRPCKTCKELTATDLAPYSGARVDFNEDHSLVAVQASFTTVHVFDAKTEQRLATFHAWKTPMGPAYRSYVLTGDRFIAFVSDTPVTSAGRIFDARTGKRIANVGDGDGTEIEEDAIAVGRPGLRMFHKFDSGVRWLQDLRSGRILQRFDFGNDGARLEAQAGGAFVGIGVGHPLVVYDLAANKQGSLRGADVQVSLILVAALATVAQAKPACRAKWSNDRASLSAGDHVVRACFVQPTACYVLELDGGVAQWRTAGAAPKPAPPEPDILMHAVAKVCRDGACHSYATPDEPLSLASAYHSADARVVTFEGAVVVFDAATGAERGRSAPGLNIHDVQFFADRFVAFDQDTTRIHDVATGKVIVDLGKPMGASLDLGDGTFAMSSRGRLEVFDRAGKIVRAVATGVEAPSLLVRSRDKRMLALDYVLVDTATWTVAPAPPLSCP